MYQFKNYNQITNIIIRLYYNNIKLKIKTRKKYQKTD